MGKVRFPMYWDVKLRDELATLAGKLQAAQIAKSGGALSQSVMMRKLVSCMLQAQLPSAKKEVIGELLERVLKC